MPKINLTVTKDGISFSVCKCFPFNDELQDKLSLEKNSFLKSQGISQNTIIFFVYEAENRLIIFNAINEGDDPQKNKHHMQLLASAIEQRREKILLPIFSALFDLQDWMYEENGFFASGKEVDIRADISRLAEILRLSGCPDLGKVINGMMALKFEDHFGYMPTDDDIEGFKDVIVEQVMLKD